MNSVGQNLNPNQFQCPGCGEIYDTLAEAKACEERDEHSREEALDHAVLEGEEEESR